MANPNLVEVIAKLNDVGISWVLEVTAVSVPAKAVEAVRVLFPETVLERSEESYYIRYNLAPLPPKSVSVVVETTVPSVKKSEPKPKPATV